MFDYSKITAPFDGIVTKRYADVGALIQAGTSSSVSASAVVRFAQENVLRAMFPVPESAVSAVQNGAPVRIEVTGLGRTVQGNVTRFSRQLNIQTRTMEAEVDVPNDDLSITPGMFGWAELTLEEHKDVLSVPVQAINTGENPTVYVIDKNNKVEERPVKIGLETPNRGGNHQRCAARANSFSSATAARSASGLPCSPNHGNRANFLLRQQWIIPPNNPGEMPNASQVVAALAALRHAHGRQRHRDVRRPVAQRRLHRARHPLPVSAFAAHGRLCLHPAACVRPAPPMEGGTYLDRTDWWEAVEQVPHPRIVVIEDLDRQPGAGAFIGGLHAEILHTLGCVGAVTNGAVRDLGKPRVWASSFLRATSRFRTLTRTLSRWASRCGSTGLTIHPRDLLHGDAHGVVRVPGAIAAQVPAVASRMQREEKEIIHYCRSEGFTLAGLRELLRHQTAKNPTYPAPFRLASSADLFPLCRASPSSFLISSSSSA